MSNSSKIVVGCRLLVVGYFSLPVVVFAQGTIQDALWSFADILNSLVLVLITAALVFFFWGLVKFIAHADDETARGEGKKVMVWGIIAIFVIFSVWAIVVVLQDIFSFGDVTELPDKQNF